MAKSPAPKAIESISPGIGGSYAKDPVTGELSLIEAPTAEAPRPEPAPAASVHEADSASLTIDEDQEIPS
jgi:hypothetical protein